MKMIGDKMNSIRDLLGMNENYKNGVYVSVKATDDTVAKLKEWCEKNLDGVKLTDDYHCTLIYSKKPLDEEVETKQYEASAKFKGFNIFGEEKNCLVVELDSDVLIERNKELTEKYGFISDFSPYRPHITLSYDAKDVDYSSLPSIDFEFEFNSETAEDLDEAWVG